jgi:hypothetical protein
MSTYNDDPRWSTADAEETDSEVTGAYSETSAEPARSLPRPKGPSWSTVALGLICMVIAGGALVLQFADLDLDWRLSGPLALVGLGLVLVLVGLAALARRGDEDGEDLETQG